MERGSRVNSVKVHEKWKWKTPIHEANHFLNKHKNTQTKRMKTSKGRRSYVNSVHHVPHERPVVLKAGRITDLPLPLRISQPAVKIKPRPPNTSIADLWGCQAWHWWKVQHWEVCWGLKTTHSYSQQPFLHSINTNHFYKSVKICAFVFLEPFGKFEFSKWTASLPV